MQSATSQALNLRLSVVELNQEECLSFSIVQMRKHTLICLFLLQHYFLFESLISTLLRFKTFEGKIEENK